ERAVPAITEKMLTLTQNRNIAIVIDVENVRGKTDFELDHADFLDRLMVWVSLRNHAMGRTIAVVDHGSNSTAHLLLDKKNAAFCVGFAGPHVKADDVIARDVKWLLYAPESTTQHVLVITSDQELIWRCQSAARSDIGSTAFNSILQKFANDYGYDYASVLNSVSHKFSNDNFSSRSNDDATAYNSILQRLVNEERCIKDDQLEDNITNDDTGTTIEDHNAKHKNAFPRVEIIAPERFLEDLEEAQQAWLEQSTWINNIPKPTPVATLQNLFELCGQIVSLESAIRKNDNCHTLAGELQRCKEEWNELLSSIDKNDGELDDVTLSVVALLAWSLSSTISFEDHCDLPAVLPLSSLPSSASTTSMSWKQLAPKEQEKLLLQWVNHQERHGKRADETTEDRIVLAERLRRQLELILDPTYELPWDEEEVNDADGKKPFLINQYTDYINSLRVNEKYY
ncbi:hypothetical protein ACHAXR_009071, partial [Thalassiosira sp. AJA248-18]